MKFTPAIACLLVCASFTLVQAQDAKTSAASSGPTKDPVASSLRAMLPSRQTNMVGALESMPADKYSYKPTPEQETFAHMAAHIVEANYALCSKLADVPAPKMEEAKDTDSKDKLVAAAKASFAFCSDALSKMDDSKLGDPVDLFGGRKGPRAALALHLAAGWGDHYAAEAMYLRLNGILPPSAQPKK